MDTSITTTEGQEDEKPSVPDHEQEGWDRLYTFLQEFNTESDRAVVILAAAKIDQLLCESIEALLLPVTGSKDELLESDGPLASFSARIGLCSRLGLIDADVTRSLQLLRKIRNAFAHEISGCSLQQGAQADRVRALAKPFRNVSVYALARKVSAKDHTGLSADFRASVALIIARLDYYSQRIPRLALVPLNLQHDAADP